MKKILLGFAAVLLLGFFLVPNKLIISSSSFIDSKNWRSFVLDNDPSSDSPANVGVLILDPPAGKHGFLTVKGKHFYFEDGKRARFWGTNLCFSACFPPKEVSARLADELAFYGFNAVRFHQMDADFEPQGIFKDVCPDCRNPQEKKTGILSPEQLDRLDYFIFQLKKRGIYINLNLLVTRTFTLADGVIDADKLRGGGKPLSLFDPRMIELQKKYNKDLLTHFNPYTGLSYNQDPAIALVEITNENSLFMSMKKYPMPDFYRAQLAELWKMFSKNKQSDKVDIPRKFAIWLEQKYFKDMIRFLKNECRVKVPVAGIGGAWSKEMHVSTKRCDYFDAHGYWDHPAFPNRKWDKEDFRMHNRSMLLDGQLGMAGDLARNASRKRPYTISEWDHCFPNRFAYETPVLMASKALKLGWDGLFQYAFCHDLSSYFAADGITSFFEMAGNPQQLLLNLAASYVFNNESKDLRLKIDNGILILDSESIVGAAGFIQDRRFEFDGISFLSDSDGAVFIFRASKNDKRTERFVLISVGEVKNTGSYWDGSKYHWGGKPTQIQNVGVKVKLLFNGKFLLNSADDKLAVFSLNSKGMREKKISVLKESDGFEFNTSDAHSSWFEIVSD